MPIIALVLAVVLAPAVTWAVSTIFIIPQMRAAITAEDDGSGHTEAKKEKKESGGHGGGEEGGDALESNSYKFEALVVNLAGTMGTRYLRVSFIVQGEDDLHDEFATNEIPLRDAALNVLSSLSLADLEEVGARNFIRERLVRSFNETLGASVANQIYFLDFVVQ